MSVSARLANRRRFIQGMTFGVTALASGLTLAEELALTPQMTEGPFYPDKLPLDTDNDLILVNNSVDPAVGEITHLTGRILDAKGNPIRNAFVEIWQCDHSGVYLHSQNFGGHDKQDKNFQGYGRFLTDSSGRYYFRTIKPVPYTGRTPHIHFGVSKNGHRLHTTQLFIKDLEMNERDGIYQDLGDKKTQALVCSEFKPLEGSKIGELTADFEIVLGETPMEDEKGVLRGIGRPERMRRG